MIVLVTFGAVEGASVIFLKQSLVQSAYEGSKVAIRRNATTADVLAATRAVLAGRSLHQARIEINPSNIEQARRGDRITVRVTAPSDTNSIFPFGPFQGHELAATAVMVRE